jgi:nitrite reductase/ring-hydroxylating ferredoxin subunit
MLIRVASVSELPEEGNAREFAVGDNIFCIANIHGEYRALDNMCPHRGGALGQGVVDGRGTAGRSTPKTGARCRTANSALEFTK